jgi:hypothetical protein
MIFSDEYVLSSLLSSLLSFDSVADLTGLRGNLSWLGEGELLLPDVIVPEFRFEPVFSM